MMTINWYDYVFTFVAVVAGYLMGWRNGYWKGLEGRE
jgi:hypothetical protein